MKGVKSNNYTEKFFADIDLASYQSAIEILSIVMGRFSVKSVLDFGCGTGSWLRAARDLGATRLTGIDGPWVRSDMLVAPEIELISADLTGEAQLPSNFDLAVSVEVGEHLPENYSDRLVKRLCAASTRVLFGAAIPGQGGTTHINEQWQSYWARKFVDNGYIPVDLIRPQAFEKQNVLSWYRNNTLLYVRRDEFIDVVEECLKENYMNLTSLDYVIPDVFNNPGLRHSLMIASRIPKLLFKALSWRLQIGRWRI